ncbi:MAG: NYN domain-containing protein [Chloroflexi bacterium]|nr:NYN domain-containing protein [Chloroflexota bacterium]
MRIKVWEEKGSDVNLASHLLVDGFQDDYDFAVVISNDTDLVEPIRLVQSTLGLDVWVVNPSPPPAKKGQRDNNRMHQDLRNVASVSRRIYVSTLRKSQFPNPLIDANGRTITKPASW